MTPQYPAGKADIFNLTEYGRQYMKAMKCLLPLHTYAQNISMSKKKNRNPHAHSKIKAYAVIYFYKYSPSMRQKEVQSAANEVLIDPEAGYMYTCVTIFNT